MKTTKYTKTNIAISSPQLWSIAVLTLKLMILSCFFFFIGALTANAAFPTVVATSSGNSAGNTTATAINMPSGVTSGDLLIVSFSKDGTDAPSGVTGTGWTALSGTSSINHHVASYWKIADGSDSLTINHESQGTAHAVYRITGHDSGTAPEHANYFGDDPNPDPPSLNPSAWGTEDTLWLSIISWDRDDVLEAYPENYTSNQISDEWNQANGTGIRTATYATSTSSEDPGAGTLAYTQPWAVQTIAVRPAQESNPKLSGTLYTDAGVTTAGSGKTIKIAVGTSTPSVHSTTTDSNGDWEITDVVEDNISSTTPLTIWLDGDGNDATTLAMGMVSGADFTNIPLYYNYTVIHASSSSGVIDVSDFTFYDSTDDSDILYTVTNTTASTSVASSFLINQGTFTAPSTTLSVDGSFENYDSFSANGGEVVLSSTTQNIRGDFTSTNAFYNLKIKGSYTMASSSASTTNLVITEEGSLVAPTSLTIAGNFTNSGTFDSNSGTITVDNTKNEIMKYLAGMSSDGSSGGSLFEYVETVAISGDYLYLGKTNNGTACSQTAGSADGCELMVFDISSSTNPIYVAGRDASGSGSGTGDIAIKSLAINGDYLYVGKAGNATACSQTAGSAIGCEIMIFDISSTTNPTYVAGRDGDGSSTGIKYVAVNAVSADSNNIYVVKAGSATACSQTAGSADGCEIMIFDISSSSTNPTYMAGRDVDASDNGTGFTQASSVTVNGDLLYVGKEGGFIACSQTAGSALGCALLVFDISSSSNPTYMAGVAANGSSSGNGSAKVTSIAISGDKLYLGKTGNATACSQTAGSALGCEVMVFDISSTTNLTYMAGRDVDGSADGTSNIGVNSVTVSDYGLYVGKEGNATACSQTAGSADGCEIMIFDISSSTNPVYVAGKDSKGSDDGTGSESFNSIAIAGDGVYVGKNAGFGACSQTAGSAVDCGLQVYETASGILLGDMTASSTLADVTVDGLAHFKSSASTTDLTIGTDSTLVAPDYLSVAGDFINNNTFTHSSGTVTLSGTSQSLLSPATTTFYALTKEVASADTLTFSASGTYIIEDELTLTGASSNLLSLRSTASGTEWYIDPQATTTVEYLDVKDSNNINVTTITCDTGCIDSLNNTNWTFGSGATSLISTDNYHFYVGQASTTLDQITISTEGAGITAANDLRLTIATTTTDFRFSTDNTTLTLGGTASGKVNSTVSYEDEGATLVIDVTSDFGEGDTIIVNDVEVGSFATISTTSGQFTLHTDGDISGDPATTDTKTIYITGNIALGEHTSGQVSNQFSFQNKTDEAMFAFSMTPSSENATVTDMVFTLSGVQNLDSNEFDTLRLYKDENSDGSLDGGDTLLDNSGIMNINGQHGAITFSDDFTVTASADYLIIGDATSIDKGDAVVISLPTSGITAIGITSNHAPIITGTVEEIQHLRNGSTGGGGAGRSGDIPPAGNSVETGGVSGGGGSSTDEEDGENIASDSNFFKATTTGSPDNEWTNPSNAFDSDGTYATAASEGLRQSYAGFNFNVPGTNTIKGMEVKLDISGTTASGTVDVSLSWDGGSSYTTAKATPDLSSSDVVYTVGGNTDTWGRSWTPSEFAADKFLIRVTAAPGGNTLRLDALQIRVHHQAGGGGGGGGGRI